VRIPSEPVDDADAPFDERAAKPPSTRQEEFRSFLFFTVVMAPVLAVLIVAGYGFAVWMYQIVAGPPGT
jgi:nitrate reductase NapE